MLIATIDSVLVERSGHGRFEVKPLLSRGTATWSKAREREETTTTFQFSPSSPVTSAVDLRFSSVPNRDSIVRDCKP